MFADVKLPCVITDDNGFYQQTVGLDAPPDRTFGGDLDQIRVDFEPGDAEFRDARSRLPGQRNAGRDGRPGRVITGPARLR